MLFSFQPLSDAIWPAFAELFGDKGACGGCWCMSWRLRAADFKKQQGEENKKAFYRLVEQKKPLGVLAFSGNKAVGWCAVAPRDEYIRLETSRILQPVDDQPVWSISCFFIQKEYRNKGLSGQLLKAATAYAFSRGATIVEGYPVEAENKKMTVVFAWTGFASAFAKAGFKEVARRSEKRPVMRLYKSHAKH